MLSYLQISSLWSYFAVLRGICYHKHFYNGNLHIFNSDLENTIISRSHHFFLALDATDWKALWTRSHTVHN